MRATFSSSIIALLLLLSSSFAQQVSGKYPITFVPLTKVKLTDTFWLPKIKTVQQVTIRHAFEKCEEEGRLENFLIAGGQKKGTVRGKMPFDDTDVYKIIEGASYSLMNVPNSVLDAYLDSVIALIAVGQEADGYLTTWLTIDPHNPPAWWVPKEGGRWVREQTSHELYNSGHLFEAAAAHYLATGKRTLLNIALKNADLLVKTFGYGKLTLPPGHQIVETGLIKLYHITGNTQYLALAKFFLDIRGDSTTHQLYGPYSQDHKPVLQQDEIVGHAVRAVYMYAGMTDIAALYNDENYLRAVLKIWNNMVSRKMYITGGIGSRHDGESVGDDYELPNETAYCETCASIGTVYWGARLFSLTGKAEYFNVIERVLYNALLAGISLDGTTFFYVNPLASDGKYAFNHGACTRQPWFDCSCCPTNLIRFIPSLPGFFYASQRDTLYVNLYASNTATLVTEQDTLIIEQKTDYPWEGKIEVTITPSIEKERTLRFRIPGWVRNEVLPGDLYQYSDAKAPKFVLTVNGKETNYCIVNGYISLTRQWHKGDVVQIHFPLEVRTFRAHEKVTANRGLAALEAGPLVYCVESNDNNGSVDNIILQSKMDIKRVQRRDMLGGITALEIQLKDHSKTNVTAIPYFSWANRGATAMKVWLPLH